MKTKCYSTEQIIGILKEAEAGMPVKELCRKYGVSGATIYNWRSKYGGTSGKLSRCSCRPWQIHPPLGSLSG